jgi:hypothetical protein
VKLKTKQHYKFLELSFAFSFSETIKTFTEQTNAAEKNEQDTKKGYKKIQKN